MAAAGGVGWGLAKLAMIFFDQAIAASLMWFKKWRFDRKNPEHATLYKTYQELTKTTALEELRLAAHPKPAVVPVHRDGEGGYH